MRSTARRTRLCAWPTPPVCLASSIADSIDLREALDLSLVVQVTLAGGSGIEHTVR
jgi:hypothetical protein